MNVDEAWFGGLRGGEMPEPLNSADSDDRDIIRAHWDHVEQNMRGYLAKLRDEMLFEKPFAAGEDKDLHRDSVVRPDKGRAAQSFSDSPTLHILK